MARRTVLPKDTLRLYMICALTLEFSVRLSELLGVDASTITRRYARRVRRGNPGLTKAYVEEEVIRRMAKEASRHSVFPRFGELIEVLQLEVRQDVRRRGEDAILIIAEYYFPLTEDSVFASPKYRQ